MKHPYTGTGVAMVTPFKGDRSVDYASLETLTEYLISNGVDYLVVQGTTGESATLNKAEKQKVLECILAKNKQRVPIVLGLGGNNTQAILEDLDTIDLTGVSAILSVSPYYNKPSQVGIYLHYKAIAEASTLPIILYNVPGRTGSNVTAATTLSLANDFANVVAIKEASGNFQQCLDILKGKPSHFALISGDDALTLPLIAIGAEGVISVIANAFPKQFSDLVQAALNGEYNKAKNIHYQLSELYNLLMIEGNPAGIKATLKIKGICEDFMRLPLTSVSQNTYKMIENVISSLNA